MPWGGTHTYSFHVFQSSSLPCSLCLVSINEYGQTDYISQCCVLRVFLFSLLGQYQLDEKYRWYMLINFENFPCYLCFKVCEIYLELETGPQRLLMIHWSKNCGLYAFWVSFWESSNWLLEDTCECQCCPLPIYLILKHFLCLVLASPIFPWVLIMECVLCRWKNNLAANITQSSKVKQVEVYHVKNRKLYF